MSTKGAEAEKSDAMLLEMALAVRKEDVLPLRFDPMVAKQVCTAGLVFLTQHLPTLRKQHPGIDLKALQALPAVCVLLSLAQHAAEQTRAADGASESEIVNAALTWRKKLLPFAVGLVANGLVDADEVTRIRRGRGHVDALRDVVDLVKLLTPHEELVSAACGKGALAQAQAAADEGLRVLGLKDDAQSRAATDLRDRYATLVYAGHDRLRVAVAAVSSFEEAQTIVRALRTNPRRKKPLASPEPEPVEPVM